MDPLYPRWRIIEDMGVFKIQESRVTLFGNIKWGTWQRRAMFDPDYSYDEEFSSFKEAKACLDDMLAAWKRHDELKKRGPIVHLEVK